MAKQETRRCGGCDEKRATRAYVLTWDITGQTETVQYCATCAAMVQDGHLGAGTTLTVMED